MKLFKKKEKKITIDRKALIDFSSAARWMNAPGNLGKIIIVEENGSRKILPYNELTYAWIKYFKKIPVVDLTLGAETPIKEVKKEEVLGTIRLE